MTLNYIIIGKNIKEARQKRNLSQAELAEKAAGFQTNELRLHRGFRNTYGLVAIKFEVHSSVDRQIQHLFANANVAYLEH